MTRARVARCSSCRWWDRSNNFRAKDRDWGLCHLWGGTSGHRMLNSFIDYSYGHEPRGSDTCAHHNASPEHKDGIQSGGDMPQIKCEGELP